ncbi:MAG: hypothetical protein ABI390_05765 [Daejeonella sp.]
MKKISFIIFCLIFASLYSKAQIVQIDTIRPTYHYKSTSTDLVLQSDFYYTVGFKLLSFEQLPKILNALNSNEFYASKLNGLIVKFNDNQLSYRISGSYLQKDISFENQCTDCEQTNGKLTDVQIKIGFEKNITHSILQPYFGMDIGYRNNNFKGESISMNMPNSDSSYDVTTEKNSIVYGPVLGIRLNAIKHLTLSAESGIDLLYSYERQTKAYRDAGRTQTFQKYNKFEFLTRPLAFLSVQYNFGLTN